MRSLRWLMTQQMSPAGRFRPVGTDSFGEKRQPPRVFDQQALEATATISACAVAWRADRDAAWTTTATRVFAWFLGHNDLSTPLVDVETGSCRDGLHSDRPNENRGGESVLSYLLGLAEIRQLARRREGHLKRAPLRACLLYTSVLALNRLSATGTMEAFLRFILDVVERDGDAELAPLYPIAPGLDLEERAAPALAGFLGDGPVRIGNAARTQRQNDAYGSIVLAAAQMFWDERLPLRGDLELYRRLRPIGETAARLALTADAGPWEFRGQTRIHTFSAAMCWAAMKQLGLIARRVGASDDATMWLARAEVLRDEILRRSVTPEGWISATLDGEVIDASSLLLAGLGLVGAMDPRFLATIEVTSKRLLRNGFVMRYDEADDFGRPGSAFLVCTFWYIEALASVGRREEALALFENVLTHRNHLGLLPEDIAPDTGTLWGNFPQTYSQVGLISAAMRLTRSWEEGMWHAS